MILKADYIKGGIRGYIPHFQSLLNLAIPFIVLAFKASDTALQLKPFSGLVLRALPVELHLQTAL